MKIVIDKRVISSDLVIMNCYMREDGVLAGQFDHLNYELNSDNSEVL